MKRFTLTVLFTALWAVTQSQSQTLASAAALSATKVSAVPSLVKFSGSAKDGSGKALSGVVGVTFSLYKEEQGGAALWIETQNVQADAAGHYNASLGANKPLQVELFSSGEARWLGVQVAGQQEENRVLLLSVPYALKAADAETVGGLPPSAFVLAAPPSGGNGGAAGASTSSNRIAPALGGTGTTNFLPIWTNATTLGSSALFQTGTGAAAKVGIGTTTPSTTLDVKGGETVRGNLQLPALGTATATSGFNSNPHDFVASVFNKTAAVNQTFRFQSEPAGNNTTTASGTLNLLYSAGAGVPAETGFRISNKGLLNFVPGQTFPGAGSITGVTAGGGLVGGGTTGNVTLSLLKTCAANQVLQWNGTTWVCASLSGGGTITGVTAGTDLTGGGTSGNVTLNLNTAALQTTNDARYAQLGAANAFTKNNSFAGTIGVGTTTPSAQLDVEAPATAGTGILGVTSSTGFFAAGIFGHATGTSGVTRGVYGASDSPNGIGVHGIGQTGGQFETGTGTIFVGRGQGANRVTIDSLGNTATSGTISATGSISAGGGLLAGTAGGTTAVVGIADQGPGGFFQTNGSTAGLEAESLSSGYGLRGFALGSTGQGVWGESSGTATAANGFGPDGVDGVTHSANGSGVAGVNYAAGGTAIYGTSPNGGWGFQTPNNVQQARGAGGWAKAMVFVDPFTSTGTAITRCYNSQATGATVNTPPCGFGITHDSLGVDFVDFGFQVDDRFISATVFNGGSIVTCVLDANNTCSTGLFSPTASQVLTNSFDPIGNTRVDVPFWIIVF